MSSFDDLVVAYDNSIDWDARLSRELPFLLKHLPKDSPARILDIACGSGRHSVALAKNSYSVTGFDSSQSMIDAAKQLSQPEGVSAEFLKANMLDFAEKIDSSFNLAICLGNSLALLASFEEVTQVLEQVYSILDTEGMFIFQVLNFEEILLKGFLVFPRKTGKTKAGQEVVFTRQFVLSSFENKSQLFLAAQVKNEDGWDTHVKQQSVLHLNHDWLTKVLTETGFSRIDLFGDYAEATFVADSHRNLIVRAWK